MIKIDQVKWLHCDSCHRYWKELHELAFGANISRRGYSLYLCDDCLDELRETLQKKEIIDDQKSNNQQI